MSRRHSARLHKRWSWVCLIAIGILVWCWANVQRPIGSLPQWITQSPWGRPIRQVALEPTGQILRLDYSGQWSLVYNRSSKSYHGLSPMFVPSGEGIFFLRDHQGGYPNDGKIKTITSRPLAKSKGYEIRFYSDGLLLRGLVAIPNGKGPFPAIVVCPAFERDAVYTLPWVEYFAEQRFVSITFDYRGDGVSTAPEYPALDSLPKMDSLLRIEYKLPDALSAIKAVASLPEVQKNHIGIFGHSMGASIALDSAEESPLVQAVACTGLGYNRGKQISTSYPLRVRPDPSTLANVQVPSLLIAGALDPIFPVDFVRQTSNILAKGKAPHQFIVVPNAAHAVCNSPGVRGKLVAFFDQYLRKGLTPLKQVSHQ